MYLGAWGPRVIHIALFALYTFVLSIVRPEWVPAVPAEARTLAGWALWKKCLMGIVPSAVVLFLCVAAVVLVREPAAAAAGTGGEGGRSRRGGPRQPG